MKKILFFAVMFCVALSTCMLVSCGDDDDPDSPKKDDNLFQSEIIISNDILSIYKDIKVYYKLPDGTEITNDVKSTSITFEHILTGGKQVVVRFTGTLIEEAVDADKKYDMFITYKGKLGSYSKSETTGGYAAGKTLIDNHKELGSNAGYQKHTINMEKPQN